MNRFWNLLIRPALEAAGSREIVEIGSEGGKHTQRLLEWCASRGARVHVIEPVPAYDAEKLKASFPTALVFHCATSLEILDGLGPVDAVLIDGDHNWYTVYHELKALEKVNGSRFPLVFLHDVAWPFARRDMYYAPARIPGEHRHPYLTGGVQRGQSALLPMGEMGLAPELFKATHEGGPRNGVLTAAEDFVRESALALRLETVPVGFGLGILAGEELLARRPALRAMLDEFATREFAWRIATHTEERRVDEMVELRHQYENLRMHLALLAEDLGHHQEELGRHEVEAARLREMLGSSHSEAHALRQHVDELRERLAAVDQQAMEQHRGIVERDRIIAVNTERLAEVERRAAEAMRQSSDAAKRRIAELESEIEGMRGSRSWRLTAPLRRISSSVKGEEST